MKISKVDHIVGVSGEWRESEDGTHVPLPLDVAQVSPEVVDEVSGAVLDQLAENIICYVPRGVARDIARAAIAALAAALGEEG